MILSARFALILWLLSPFLILAFYIPNVGSIDLQELIWVLKNSLLQAILSAGLSVALGLGGLFLVFKIQMKWGDRARKALELFLLLPTLLPPIFVLLAVLKVIQPFPFGVLGIVLVHGFMNGGLCSVVLARLLNSSSQNLMELCWLEGCGALRFLSVSLFGYLKSSLGSLFLLVFSLSLTSFSVPLIVAGDQGITLEVLIYEKIRIQGDLAAALSLALVQTALVFFLSLSIQKEDSPAAKGWANSPLLASWWPGLPVLFMTLIIFFSCLSGWLSGWERILEIPSLLSTLGGALLGSLIVGLGVGLLAFVLLQLVLFLSPSQLLHRFLLGYIAPSSVIAGFSYLLVTPNNIAVSFARLLLVLCLLSLPTLYRMGWSHQLSVIRGQLTIAETLGATVWQRFWFVSFPQTAQTAGWLAGVAAFWASGDFALSRILLGREATLALIVDSLIGFYRIDMAMTLSGLLFLLGILIALLMGGLGYVSSRKSYP